MNFLKKQKAIRGLLMAKEPIEIVYLKYYTYATSELYKTDVKNNIVRSLS